MNKDKHVLPDDRDTFSDRVRREAKKERKTAYRKTIYGPDNEPLVRVEMSKELAGDENR
ncbi:MAG: hypothetical protein N2645_12665 [Clostridia bacterium]|nr:hypothetical protein [Clostridia bacterium]